MTNEITTTEPIAGAPVAYKGVPVMTTGALAAAFGATDKQISNNFTRNRDRFLDGEHYYRVSGADLKQLKASPLWEGKLEAASPIVMLWTERGALVHAKILETPEAWAVYGKLVDTYFAVKAGLVAAPAPAKPALSLARVTSDYRALVRLARDFGMDANQAALAAARGTKEYTGVDPLPLIGITSMVAPQQAAHLTATQIGEQVGARVGAVISARGANIMLAQFGFQVPDKSSDAGWRPTAQGEPHAVWLDTAKKHSNGAPVRQLRWAATIVDAVLAVYAQARAAGAATGDCDGQV